MGSENPSLKNLFQFFTSTRQQYEGPYHFFSNFLRASPSTSSLPGCGTRGARVYKEHLCVSGGGGENDGALHNPKTWTDMVLDEKFSRHTIT